MYIKRHWAYLNYLLKHKWFVLQAGARIGLPLWQLLKHDASKFSLLEWDAYSRTFYTETGEKQYDPQLSFDYAWLHHQHHNLHHWQYWVLREDSGTLKVLKMPERYALEMVADWMGAGRAITGAWDIGAWYLKNRETILLHEETRMFVEWVIRIQERRLGLNTVSEWSKSKGERTDVD